MIFFHFLAPSNVVVLTVDNGSYASCKINAHAIRVISVRSFSGLLRHVRGVYGYQRLSERIVLVLRKYASPIHCRKAVMANNANLTATTTFECNVRTATIYNDDNVYNSNITPRDAWKWVLGT